MIINLHEFQHLFDGKDATLAVQEALRACKQGSTLKLGGGELHFTNKYAYEKEYYISNNDYSKKSIIFPLIGMKDITIDGEGAELKFHGEVLPFVIDGSENIVLKDFKVDYPQPYYFQADITAAGRDFLELEYDTREFNVRVEGRQLVFFSPEDAWEIVQDSVLAMEFDKETASPSAYIPPYFTYLPEESDSSFLSRMNRYVKAIQLGDHKIRFEGDFGHIHTVGNKWVCIPGYNRKCPGVFGNRAKDILVQDITLYHTAAMGIICQLCENITLENVNALPRKGSGRVLSVCADATHFVNCSGVVRYEGCTFTNMLDDAGNIHGNYMKIVKKINNNTVLLGFGYEQQRGVLVYDPGDEVRIINSRDMTLVANLIVKSSHLISGDFVRLEFCEELPDMREDFVVENFTKMPELYINNCITGNNRPRGFLPTTWKKTVITNNTFYNMNSGLEFIGDCSDWFESGPVNDVQIRNNRFCNSAYAGGNAISIIPKVPGGSEPYHKNIVIEENEFEMHEERFLCAKYVDNLVFRNNRFVQNDLFPSHRKTGKNGIDVNENCRNVVIECPVQP